MTLLVEFGRIIYYDAKVQGQLIPNSRGSDFRRYRNNVVGPRLQ